MPTFGIVGIDKKEEEEVTFPALTKNSLSTKYPGLAGAIERSHKLGLSDEVIDKGITQEIAEAKRRGATVEAISRQLGPPPTNAEPFKFDAFRGFKAGVGSVLEGLKDPIGALGITPAPSPTTVNPAVPLGERFKRIGQALLDPDPEVIGAPLGGITSAILSLLDPGSVTIEEGGVTGTLGPLFAPAVGPNPQVPFGRSTFGRFIAKLRRAKKVKSNLSSVDIRAAMGAGPGTPTKEASNFVKSLSTKERADLFKLVQKKEGLGGSGSPRSTSTGSRVQASTPAQATSAPKVTAVSKAKISTQTVKDLQKGTTVPATSDQVGKAIAHGATVTNISPINKVTLGKDAEKVKEEQGGGVEVETLEVVKVMQKYGFSGSKRGRKISRDLLKDIDPEKARLVLMKAFTEVDGLSPESAAELVANINNLKVKRILYNNFIKEKGKVGRKKLPGVSIRSNVEVTDALTDPAALAKIDPDIKAPVVKAGVRKTTRLPEEELEDVTLDTVKGKTIRIQRSPADAAITFQKLKEQIIASAGARGFSLTLEGTQVVLVGPGGTKETFSSLVEARSELLKRNILKQEPVTVTPVKANKEGTQKSTIEKAISGKKLDAEDVKTLKAQVKRNVIKEDVDKVEQELGDALIPKGAFDPDSGRGPGSQPFKGDVVVKDPDLGKKVSTEAAELEALIRQSNRDNKKSVLKELVEDEVKDVFDKGGGIDGFGMGMGQMVAKIFSRRARFRKKSILQKKLDKDGLVLSQLHRRRLLLELGRTLGIKKPKDMENFLRKRGMEEEIIQFVTTRLLIGDKQPTKVVFSLFQPLQIDDLIVNEAGFMFKTTEMGFEQELATMREWTKTNLRDKFDLNSMDDRRVRRYVKGELKNPSPVVREAGDLIRKLYGDTARRLGIPMMEKYATSLTDFDMLFDTYVQELTGVSWEALDPRYKSAITSAKQLRNVQRILRIKSWGQVSQIDRKELKKAFNFTVREWADLPEGIKNSIPKTIFNPFLIKKTDAKIPTKLSAIESIETYMTVTLRTLYFQPLLDHLEGLVDGLNVKGAAATSPILARFLTNKGYIEEMERMIIGRPTDPDKLINYMINKVNATLGLNLLSEQGLDTAIAITKGATYRALLGPDSAVANVIGGTLNTWAETGKLLGPMNKMITSYKETGDVQGLFGGVSKMIREELQDVKDIEKSVLNAKLRQVDEVLNRIFLSPMAFTEFLNRGIAFWAGVEAAIAEGVDPLVSVSLGAGKASRVLKNPTMTDVFAETLGRTIPRTQFSAGGAATRSPFIRGRGPTSSMMFSQFPINQFGFMKSSIMRAVRNDDNMRLARFIAVSGVFFGIPKLFAEMGIDISNILGSKSFWFRLGGPMWGAVFNGLEALNGKSPSSEDRAGREWDKFLRGLAKPWSRWTDKTLDTLDGISKGVAVDRKGRAIYTIGEGQDVEVWEELLRLIGAGPQIRVDRRQMMFNIMDYGQEFMIDKRNAINTYIDSGEQDDSALEALKKKYPSAQVGLDDINREKRNRRRSPRKRAKRAVPKDLRKDINILKELQRGFPQ